MQDEKVQIPQYCIYYVKSKQNPDPKLKKQKKHRTISYPQNIMCFPICFPRFHDGQVIWALRLLMNWSMDGILALFWMRSSMRIWLMAVRYMPQCCSKHRVLMAFLLTMPAALMLTLILFSCDICMYLSKDVACASA